MKPFGMLWKSYLNVDNSTKFAEMLIQFGNIVDIPGDFANFKLGVGVGVMIFLLKARFMLVVEILP